MGKKEQKYYVFNYNLGILNFLSLLLLVGLGIVTYYLYKWGFINSMFGSSSAKWNDFEFIFFILGMFGWIILHEFIHGIMYYLNGAEWKNIVFGVELEKGVFCCLCKEEISRKNILISSISPCLIIGVITYVLGIVFHNMILILFSIMNIGSSIADIVLFLYLLKLPSDIKFREYDDATGFCIVSKSDIKDIKSYGLKLIDVFDDNKKISNDKYPKFYISKTSRIIVSLFLVVILLCILNISF